jgi:hypothetical protein
VEWPKLFDKFKAVFRFEGRKQKQSIRRSQNVVPSQSRGAPAQAGDPVVQVTVTVDTEESAS